MVEVITVRGGPPCSICKGRNANVSPTCAQCEAKISDICFECARGDCPKCGGKLEKPPAFAQRIKQAIDAGSLELIEMELAKDQGELEESVRAGHAPTFAAATYKSAARALEMTKLFLERGVPVDARDDGGRTVLAYMLWVRPPVHLSVAELYRRTVNVQDNQGRTPLMIAAAGTTGNKKGNLAAAQMLLGFRADLLVQDNAGRTALGHALKDNDNGTNEDMVHLLKEGTIAAVAMMEFRKQYRHSFDEKGVLHYEAKKAGSP